MRKERLNQNRPYIKTILGGNFESRGNKIKEATAGDCIRIVGKRFGKSPGKVVAYFDEIGVKPMSFPYSDSEMIVICPLVKKETKSLLIRIGREVSNIKRFKVTQPQSNQGPVGTVTKKYFDAIDHSAALIAGFARAIAPYTPYQKEILNTSQNIDHARVVLQTVNDLLMKWAPLQAEMEFEPLKTIKTMDDIILQSHLIEGVENYIDSLFGEEGPVAVFLGKEFLSVDTFFGTAKDLGGYLGSIIAETGLFSPQLNSYYDATGFILHEFTKLIEGGENIAKILKPSAEVGVGAGAEGSVDAEFDWGQIFSALAKFIDIFAQILTKISTTISGKESSAKIDRLEEKADRERVLVFDLKIKLDHLEEDVKKLEEKLDRMQQKNDTQYEKLETKSDKAEEKLDKIGQNIDGLEQKADKAEEKLDTLEMKADKSEEKLDRIEQKNDREEQKLDVVEEKLDKAEQKLDVLEQKADRAEVKLDRIEEKNDKEEQKLDKLEQKADKAEQKLDKIEQKNDKQEQKLDKAEGKLDKAEQKLDRLELKADKVEGKLDKLETKNDKEEEKLDKIEVKLDAWPIYQLPHESSIAHQQTGTGKSTAAIIALKADNNLYLKAAKNVTGDELDQQASWASWKNFERPANAQVLIDVSIDLQYLENSSNLIHGVITVRDGLGKIFIRTFKGKDHQFINSENEWSDWEDFPGQP